MHVGCVAEQFREADARGHVVPFYSSPWPRAAYDRVIFNFDSAPLETIDEN
jgi:hypothetical protein